MQVGENKVVLTNTGFKGKCHTCGKYGHKQNKHLEKDKSEEEERNKKFLGKCNHCSKVEHKAANCREHDANKGKRLIIGRKKKTMR